MSLRIGAVAALAVFIQGAALAQTGEASWYGGGEKLNRHTANGEVFKPQAFTCAHRKLPFGTRVKVIHQKSGRSVICRVNDRGPAAWTGRIIDLSRAAGAALGIIRAGEARVMLRVLRQ
jgi:rare lipoprotein A